MSFPNKLYTSFFNPLLIKPAREAPKQVAIIGAGTIGPDIGYYVKSALPEIKLYLIDVVDEALKAAQQRLEGYAKKAVDRRKMSEDQAETVLKNIYYTVKYEDIRDCELIIEAATENIPLKQKIFKQVEEIVSEDAIITSNTSSIPADRIFSEMKNPQRATVTHFFAPAWRSLPVEVIKWEGVRQEVVDYLMWFFADTGKAPIITDNAICFMLDRIFDNWCNDAAYLLDRASASQIDKVAEEFVFAGPFFVLNMANGNPIIIETNTLQMEEGDHYKPALILGSVAKWKTHRPGSKVEIDENLSKQIRDRLLGILFSQSFDIIDRGIGLKEDLNFGCQVALGFRKGPFDIMKDLGESRVNKVMQKFVEDRPGFPQAKESFSFYQDFNRFLLVDDLNGVKVITIRRPQAMNALNDEVTDEILGVFKKYMPDPEVKGFVLTGYGKTAFSAGADIGKFPEMLGDLEAAVKYARSCAEVQLFMDKMEKPVVAAVNGLALGGGFELAIRCHSIVATKNARFQLPEITLGILPGIGGCVVPYRKWPKGGELFHEMICFAKSIDVSKAVEIGMVRKVTDTYRELIDAAVEEVARLSGNLEGIKDGPISIPDIQVPEQPMAGKLPLSKEVISIIVKTIKSAAKADNFEEALEIGYRGFGETACTEAAKEGITAFLEKRKPEFRR